MRNDFKVGQRVRRIGYVDVGTITDVEENYVTVVFEGPGVRQGYFPATAVERVADFGSSAPEGNGQSNGQGLFHSDSVKGQARIDS
ncbi:MAG TPA: hypothetical protein VJS65_11170 [Verrucomicrobiae bacterium]|nr:hypothetical protein [Verrucomicrobiae bacterium]